MNNLTNEDLNNLIAFINRAQITGIEAEVALNLKNKLNSLITKEPTETPKGYM